VVRTALQHIPIQNAFDCEAWMASPYSGRLSWSRLLTVNRDHGIFYLLNEQSREEMGPIMRDRSPQEQVLSTRESALSAHDRRRYAGQNHTRVRKHNHHAVLRALLSHGPTSRSHLVKLTGLRPATVSSLISELIHQGIVREIGAAVNTGIGRPSIELDFAPHGVYAVGVNMGLEWITIGLVSPRGTVHYKHEFPRPSDVAPAETVALAIAAIEDLLIRASIPQDRIIGIGIGLPGIVDPRDGRAIAVVDLDWHDVAIAGPFQSAFDLPVLVGNNAQAMGLAESWFGADRDVGDLVLLYVGSVVGAGAVIDGRLLRGSGWGAGQIGHSPIIPGIQTRCSCGNVGCLETVISDQAIVRDALAHRVHLASYDADRNLPTQVYLDELIEVGLAGNPTAIAVLARAGEHIGAAAAYLINLFNPPQIVLAGRLMRARHLVFDPMQRAATSSSLPLLAQSTQFMPSALGVDARIIGPASLVLVDCFYTAEHLLYR